MKRILLGILVLVLVGGGAAWLSVGGRADPPSFRTAPVERGELISTVSASGTLNAVVLVEVGSQVSGQIRDLYADFNDIVKQGQVIARIDPETFEARVNQAKAELDVAEAAIEVQKAQILQRQADVENAKAALAAAEAQTLKSKIAVDDMRRDVERKEPLAARGVVSASEIDKARLALRSAEAQLATSRAQQQAQASLVRSAEAQAKMAEAQLLNAEAQLRQKAAALRQAEVDLDRTYIRAPVDGVVVNRAVNRGQTVAASLQAPVLFSIAQDLSRMEVGAAVVEADVGRIAEGQKASFTVDAYPGRTFRGEVMQIRKASQTIQNVVTYTVVISAENEDKALLPGMTANLRIVVAKREDALKVPNAALRFRLPEQTTEAAPRRATRGAEAPQNEPGLPGRVFVLDPDGRPRAVPVRIGVSDGQMTEILAGDLAPGDPVIIASMSRTPANAQGAQRMPRMF